MQLRDRACRIRLLAMDVDGVLTDGSLLYGPEGEELKVFHVRDGMGITLAHRAGLEVAFVTGRETAALARRAEDLKVRHIRQGAGDKLAALRELAEQLGVKPAEIAYIGDDLNDLAAFRYVGLPVAVPGSPQELHDAAAYTTRNPGGRGAVREVVELLLRIQGKWELVLEQLQKGMSVRQ